MSEIESGILSADTQSSIDSILKGDKHFSAKETFTQGSLPTEHIKNAEDITREEAIEAFNGAYELLKEKTQDVLKKHFTDGQVKYLLDNLRRSNELTDTYKELLRNLPEGDKRILRAYSVVDNGRSRVNYDNADQLEDVFVEKYDQDGTRIETFEKEGVPVEELLGILRDEILALTDELTKWRSKYYKIVDFESEIPLSEQDEIVKNYERLLEKRNGLLLQGRTIYLFSERSYYSEGVEHMDPENDPEQHKRVQFEARNIAAEPLRQQRSDVENWMYAVQTMKLRRNFLPSKARVKNAPEKIPTTPESPPAVPPEVVPVAPPAPPDVPDNLPPAPPDDGSKPPEPLSPAPGEDPNRPEPVPPAPTVPTVPEPPEVPPAPRPPKAPPERISVFLAPHDVSKLARDLAERRFYALMEDPGKGKWGNWRMRRKLRAREAFLVDKWAREYRTILIKNNATTARFSAVSAAARKVNSSVDESELVISEAERKASAVASKSRTDRMRTSADLKESGIRQGELLGDETIQKVSADSQLYKELTAFIRTLHQEMEIGKAINQEQMQERMRDFIDQLRNRYGANADFKDFFDAFGKDMYGENIGLFSESILQEVEALKSHKVGLSALDKMIADKKLDIFYSKAVVGANTEKKYTLNENLVRRMMNWSKGHPWLTANIVSGTIYTLGYVIPATRSTLRIFGLATPIMGLGIGAGLSAWRKHSEFRRDVAHVRSRRAEGEVVQDYAGLDYDMVSAKDLVMGNSGQKGMTELADMLEQMGGKIDLGNPEVQSALENAAEIIARYRYGQKHNVDLISAQNSDALLEKLGFEPYAIGKTKDGAVIQTRYSPQALNAAREFALQEALRAVQILSRITDPAIKNEAMKQLYDMQTDWNDIFDDSVRKTNSKTNRQAFRTAAIAGAKGATGGAITALGTQMLISGAVNFAASTLREHPVFAAGALQSMKWVHDAREQVADRIDVRSATPRTLDQVIERLEDLIRPDTTGPSVLNKIVFQGLYDAPPGGVTKIAGMDIDVSSSVSQLNVGGSVQDVRQIGFSFRGDHVAGFLRSDGTVIFEDTRFGDGLDTQLEVLLHGAGFQIDMGPGGILRDGDLTLSELQDVYEGTARAEFQTPAGDILYINPTGETVVGGQTVQLVDFSNTLGVIEQGYINSTGQIVFLEDTANVNSDLLAALQVEGVQFSGFDIDLTLQSTPTDFPDDASISFAIPEGARYVSDGALPDGTPKYDLVYQVGTSQKILLDDIYVDGAGNLQMTEALWKPDNLDISYGGIEDIVFESTPQTVPGTSHTLTIPDGATWDTTRGANLVYIDSDHTPHTLLENVTETGGKLHAEGGEWVGFLRESASGSTELISITVPSTPTPLDALGHPEISFPVPDNASFIDRDADGDLDLVFSNPADGKEYVLLQDVGVDSDGKFVASDGLWKVDEVLKNIDTRGTVDVMGPSGLWEQATYDEVEQIKWDSHVVTRNQLLTFKDGDAVELRYDNTYNNGTTIPQLIADKRVAGELVWSFRMPGSMDMVIVSDGADGVADGILRLDPNDMDPTHMVRDAAGNDVMTLGEFSRIVLNTGAYDHLPDGDIHTEWSTVQGGEYRRNVFNLGGSSNGSGMIHVGYMENQDTFHSFATILGEGDTPTQIEVGGIDYELTPQAIEVSDEVFGYTLDVPKEYELNTTKIPGTQGDLVDTLHEYYVATPPVFTGDEPPAPYVPFWGDKRTVIDPSYRYPGLGDSPPQPEDDKKKPKPAQAKPRTSKKAETGEQNQTEQPKAQNKETPEKIALRKLIINDHAILEEVKPFLIDAARRTPDTALDTQDKLRGVSEQLSEAGRAFSVWLKADKSRLDRAKNSKGNVQQLNLLFNEFARAGNEQNLPQSRGKKITQATELDRSPTMAGAAVEAAPGKSTSEDNATATRYGVFLADGIGSQNTAADSSRKVIETIKKKLNEKHNRDEILPKDEAVALLKEALREVAKLPQSQLDTTLTLAIVAKKDDGSPVLITANLGDSATYLVSPATGRVQRLTREDSHLAVLPQHRDKTSGEKYRDPARRYITLSAGNLGTDTDLEELLNSVVVSYDNLELHDGDYIVAMSDGVTDNIPTQAAYQELQGKRVTDSEGTEKTAQFSPVFAGTNIRSFESAIAQIFTDDDEPAQDKARKLVEAAKRVSQDPMHFNAKPDDISVAALRLRLREGQAQTSPARRPPPTATSSTPPAPQPVRAPAPAIQPLPTQAATAQARTPVATATPAPPEAQQPVTPAAPVPKPIVQPPAPPGARATASALNAAPPAGPTQQAPSREQAQSRVGPQQSNRISRRTGRPPTVATVPTGDATDATAQTATGTAQPSTAPQPVRVPAPAATVVPATVAAAPAPVPPATDADSPLAPATTIPVTVRQVIHNPGGDGVPRSVMYVDSNQSSPPASVMPGDDDIPAFLRRRPTTPTRDVSTIAAPQASGRQSAVHIEPPITHQPEPPNPAPVETVANTTHITHEDAQLKVVGAQPTEADGPPPVELEYQERMEQLKNQYIGRIVDELIRTTPDLSNVEPTWIEIHRDLYKTHLENLLEVESATDPNDIRIKVKLFNPDLLESGELDKAEANTSAIDWLTKLDPVEQTRVVGAICAIQAEKNSQRFIEFNLGKNTPLTLGGVPKQLNNVKFISDVLLRPTRETEIIFANVVFESALTIVGSLTLRQGTYRNIVLVGDGTGDSGISRTLNIDGLCTVDTLAVNNSNATIIVKRGTVDIIRVKGGGRVEFQTEDVDEFKVPIISESIDGVIAFPRVQIGIWAAELVKKKDKLKDATILVIEPNGTSAPITVQELEAATARESLEQIADGEPPKDMAEATQSSEEGATSAWYSYIDLSGVRDKVNNEHLMLPGPAHLQLTLEAILAKISEDAQVELTATEKQDIALAIIAVEETPAYGEDLNPLIEEIRTKISSRFYYSTP